MSEIDRAVAALGNEPPVSGDGRSGPPDRREVSARWLSGTFLTGITSSVLMGAALLAALDGHEQLATPPEIASLTEDEASDAESKMARVVPARTVSRDRDRRRMEVSTIISTGDRNLVRTVPFQHVKIALAAGHTTTREYPPFDPLAVFAEDGAARTATTGLIYGAKVESEVSFRSVEFPIETAAFDENNELTADEVEEVVRTTGSVLTEGAVQVAALHYVDPQRFGQSSLAVQTLGAGYGVRIVPENVSVAHRLETDETVTEFAEDIIPFRSDREILDAYLDAGYAEEDVKGWVRSLSTLLGGSRLKAGTVLRVGIETRGDESSIVRSSIYNGETHLLSIAIDDRGQFVPGDEPELNPEILTAFDDSPPVRVRGDLPSVYDGIYRAAYSYGLTKDMTRQMIKLLASDVDYQSRLNPSDRIEVFFSDPEEDGSASPDSELLYLAATFNGTARAFYRFQMEDGTIDYFDQEGRSARQFLLRNPVPNGQFRSGFGMRRHPILGYSKMHTGVDWSAPRGTPIIASGNGVVEEAGWSGGYGRHTVIRHSNGYKTSYSHQSGIAKGIAEGGRVRQGQVIGYVGATGLATGSHLHYELIVNGTKVDPMRVRLPTSRVLKDHEMEAFTRERERIDELLIEDNSPPLKVAAAG